MCSLRVTSETLRNRDLDLFGFFVESSSAMPTLLFLDSVRLRLGGREVYRNARSVLLRNRDQEALVDYQHGDAEQSAQLM